MRPERAFSGGCVDPGDAAPLPQSQLLSSLSVVDAELQPGFGLEPCAAVRGGGVWALGYRAPPRLS